jgi:hypothetical protein
MMNWCLTMWRALLAQAILAALAGRALACKPAGMPNSGVTIGKPTYVCLVVSGPNWNNGKNNFSRVAFTPTVDRFARLQFADCESKARELITGVVH